MTRPRAVALLATTFLAAAFTAAACSSETTPAQPPGPSSPATSVPAAAPAATGPTITIGDMQFRSPPSVPPGATVTVVNSDAAEHSVTADSAQAFDVDVDGNGRATFTSPTQPGTYPYHCTYHPTMHGQLVVG